MSDIPRDHKIFNYIFNNGLAEYWFDFKDNVFGYWYQDKDEREPRWNVWKITLRDLENTYSPYDYEKAKIRVELVGPVQPPPSPIIKKIREMAQRRQISYA